MQVDNCQRISTATLSDVQKLQKLESLSAADIAQLAPHPEHTPTPPLTGRTAEELRQRAWRHALSKRRAEVEASEREMRRRDEKEERDRRRMETLEQKKRQEDKEREERAAAEELVLEFRDSLSQNSLPPWGYHRHYYSFHIQSAIKIQALQRGRALRNEVRPSDSTAHVPFAHGLSCSTILGHLVCLDSDGDTGMVIITTRGVYACATRAWHARLSPGRSLRWQRMRTSRARVA